MAGVGRGVGSKWLAVELKPKTDENITETDYAPTKRIKSPDFYR